jgi:hypothetical protein
MSSNQSANHVGMLHALCSTSWPVTVPASCATSLPCRSSLTAAGGTMHIVVVKPADHPIQTALARAVVLEGAGWCDTELG